MTHSDDELAGRWMDIVDRRLDELAAAHAAGREREAEEHVRIRSEVAASEVRLQGRLESVADRMDDRIFRGTLAVVLTVAAAATAQGFL